MIGAVPDKHDRTHNRLAVLDAMRGFALFGILFVNLTWFTGYAVMSAAERQALGTSQVDEVVFSLIGALVDGKFWSLFAFLFGVGVAIQWAHATERGVSFLGPYTRRMLVLLLIGGFHGVFLWFGDILSLYAATGLFLPLVLGFRNSRLLLVAILLLVGPVIQNAALTNWGAATDAIPVSEGTYGPELLLGYFGEGTYGEAWLANWAFLKMRWVLALQEGRFFKLLGMFALGAWFYRSDLFVPKSGQGRFWIRVVAVAGTIGLTANIAVTSWPSFLPESDVPLGKFIGDSLKTIGVPLLALAYAAVIVIGHNFEPFRRALSVFSVAGRISLTCYLTQSVVLVILFYGYGLGLWGSIGPTASLGIIVVLFTIQSLAGQMWLRRFRYGPFEWLWRCATYGKLLPLTLDHPGERNVRAQRSGLGHLAMKGGKP